MTPAIHRITRTLRPYTPEHVHTPSLTRTLQRLGATVIGAGLFGVVIDAGDFVIKIFKADDEAYLDFLDFCDTVDSPYLPTILWDKQINEKLWAVCIEKLEPLVEDAEDICDIDVDHPEYQAIRKYVSSVGFRPSVQDKELKALLDLLNETRLREGHWQDLHCGNVMLRDEQLVITDPWC